MQGKRFVVHKHLLQTFALAPFHPLLHLVLCCDPQVALLPVLIHGGSGTASHEKPWRCKLAARAKTQDTPKLTESTRRRAARETC